MISGPATKSREVARTRGSDSKTAIPLVSRYDGRYQLLRAHPVLVTATHPIEPESLGNCPEGINEMLLQNVPFPGALTPAIMLPAYPQGAQQVSP